MALPEFSSVIMKSKVAERTAYLFVDDSNSHMYVIVEIWIIRSRRVLDDAQCNESL